MIELISHDKYTHNYSIFNHFFGIISKKPKANHHDDESVDADIS